MNDLSVRGVYRRYVVEPRIELFGTSDPTIVGDPHSFWVGKDLVGGPTTSLKSVVRPLAFTAVGPADWYQNVCDNIVGSVSYYQTWTHLDVRILLVPDAGVTAATLAAVSATWMTGIESLWNSPAHTPGGTATPWLCARADEVPCRVSIKIHWVISAPHHVVSVHAGSGATDENDWYTSDPGSTAAHEVGHMLGHPDEYADPVKCPDRVPVGTGTVMDTNSTFVPDRLVQFVADRIGSNLQ